MRFSPLSSRWAIGTSVVSASLAMASATYPGGSATLFRDLVEHDSLRDQTAAAEKSNADLDASIASLGERIAVRELWMQELIAGRVTLRETALRFQEINRDNQAYRKAVEETQTGATFEEKVARRIVDDAATIIAAAPAHSEALGRIQNEFRASYGKPIIAE